MSVGELPHDQGYLVLDEIELCSLLDLDPDAGQLRYSDLRDGRLTLAEIPLEVLSGCSTERLRGALAQVQVHSLDAIRSLRDPGSEMQEHHRGRLHAFYSLLHTNATLALDEL
jgi:hypothetical protein